MKIEVMYEDGTKGDMEVKEIVITNDPSSTHITYDRADLPNGLIVFQLKEQQGPAWSGWGREII